MWLSISKSKSATSLYVIKSIYENGKHSSKIVEKLGTIDSLTEKLDGQDPIEWAKNYILQLNQLEKEEKFDVPVSYSSSKLIAKNEQHFFNGGYLFLQQIYHELGLSDICKGISRDYKCTFDLNAILSRLIYGRILFPSSKFSTDQLSKKFIEQTNFEIQHIYQVLEVIAENTDFIQAQLYANSRKIAKRNTKIFYYDCTSDFFEIEQEEGLKQHGTPKEYGSNPIVQMGLFMDEDGIPLAFCIKKGNTNEQLTFSPLEKKILSDFKLSQFIVCTDAGLASADNREFNDLNQSAFVTTQSIKKLKEYLKEWSLSSTGWYLCDDSKTYDISTLDEDVSAIIRISQRRWESEECFHIMKSEFKARPVYLSREDRIKAHFTICFIALTIDRLLEKRLQGQFTCHEIIEGLRNMHFQEIKGEGYVPAYTRTDLTDALHEAFGFRTDYQIVAMSKMKKIFKATKNK